MRSMTIMSDDEKYENEEENRTTVIYTQNDKQVEDFVYALKVKLGIGKR